MTNTNDQFYWLELFSNAFFHTLKELMKAVAVILVFLGIVFFFRDQSSDISYFFNYKFPELANHWQWVVGVILVVCIYKGFDRLYIYYRQMELMKKAPFQQLIEQGFEVTKGMVEKIIDSRSVTVEWDVVDARVRRGEGGTKNAIVITIYDLQIANPRRIQEEYRSYFEGRIFCFNNSIEYQLIYDKDRPSVSLINQRIDELLMKTQEFMLVV